MSLRAWGRALLLLGAALPPLAFATSRLLGEEVTLLLRSNTPSEQEEMRRIRDPRDDPAEIYGRPDPAGAIRVMWPEAARRIVPVEEPGRVLYVADPTRDHPPLQARTFLTTAFASAAVLLASGGLLLVLGACRSRRIAARPDTSGQAPHRGQQ